MVPQRVKNQLRAEVEQMKDKYAEDLEAERNTAFNKCETGTMRLIELAVSGDYIFQCPGCKSTHTVTTLRKNAGGAKWTFNGDMSKPTFTPSVHVVYDDLNGNIVKRCHSFIENGMIQYLPDCTHDLAGQTVELPEWKQRIDNSNPSQGVTNPH